MLMRLGGCVSFRLLVRSCVSNAFRTIVGKQHWTNVRLGDRVKHGRIITITQSFDLTTLCHAAVLDIPQHIVVVIVPAEESATQAQPDADETYAPSWKQQLSRGGAEP